MRHQILTASVLACGLAWSGHTVHAAGELCSNGAAPGSTNLCAGEATDLDPAAVAPARSSFVERALQTRVGTQRATLDSDTRDELCQQGNASREELALHLAARLDQDGADNITRGNMVERKVLLKLPCA